MSRFEKVAVLMGGTSSEREVSLQSGANVAGALAKSRPESAVLRVRLDADSLSGAISGADAAFIALHGGWGEDGGVQSALDELKIPYTGPGAAACRLAMDKIATKRRLDEAGVPNAPWCTADASASECPLPFPCVVKPPCDGSSVGVFLVKDATGWTEARDKALALDKAFRERAGAGGEPEILVEAFVPGREMTVGVLDGETLPVEEICAPGGWYDYEAKYLSDATRYGFPDDTSLPARCPRARLAEIALAAFRACGCRGVSRVDFRVSPDGDPFILELNTSPGMTAHSLVPKAAAQAGMDFPALCERILETAKYG